MNRVWKSWAPAAAAAAVIGAAALTGPLVANASVDLPAKMPAEVLELAGESTVDSLSGTIEQTSDLGLPDLSPAGPGQGPAGPGQGPAGPDSPSAESAALEMLTESHTARIYVDGPSKLRIQVLDQLAERNLIKNGDELWYYDSEENSAVHATVPSLGKHHQKPANALTPEEAGAITPAKLAETFLDKIDSSTDVAVGDDRVVAGRSAYNLILTARSEDTLVGSVSIAVDGQNGLPLAVSVTARGDDAPAFSVAFTDISFEPPAATLFDFTPPASATVIEHHQNTVTERDGSAVTEGDGAEGDGAGDPADEAGTLKQRAADHQKAGDATEPKVSGSGWATVLELPAGTPLAAASGTDLLNRLGTPVEQGSLVQTKLVSVLVTDDGRVLVGAVVPERLQAIAAGR